MYLVTVSPIDVLPSDVSCIDVYIRTQSYYVSSSVHGPTMHALLAYDGGIDSLLKPKLTNRLKSWKTSLFVVPSLGGVSVPVTGVAAPGGDARAAKMPSPAVNAPPLLAWLLALLDWPGSMSNDVKKDVLSRSLLVLVIVKKESKRSFCSALVVPLRSRICERRPGTITNMYA